MFSDLERFSSVFNILVKAPPSQKYILDSLGCVSFTVQSLMLKDSFYIYLLKGEVSLFFVLVKLNL